MIKEKIQRIFWSILVGIFSLFLAKTLVPGVSLEVIPGKSTFLGIKFTKDWQVLLFVGAILGGGYLVFRPILNLISWPLKILFGGIFLFFLNMFLIFLLDLIFVELELKGFSPLFLTTIIFSFLNTIFKI